MRGARRTRRGAVPTGPAGMRLPPGRQLGRRSRRVPGACGPSPPGASAAPETRPCAGRGGPRTPRPRSGPLAVQRRGQRSSESDPARSGAAAYQRFGNPTHSQPPGATAAAKVVSRRDASLRWPWATQTARSGTATAGYRSVSSACASTSLPGVTAPGSVSVSACSRSSPCRLAGHDETPVQQPRVHLRAHHGTSFARGLRGKSPRLARRLTPGSGAVPRSDE